MLFRRPVITALNSHMSIFSGEARAGSKVTALAAGSALALLLMAGGCVASSAKPRGDIVIDGKNVHPESITSLADGTVITGSLGGTIYRAGPQENVAKPWIVPDAQNELLAVFGVLADERSRTLWLCSVPNPFGPPKADAVSSLMAFDLGTGQRKGVYPLPTPGPVCNDMTVGADGSVYAADTANGRILKLVPGASALTLWGEGEPLKGIDGIAFDGSGVLYVNIVTRGALIRVETQADGTMGALTELTLSQPISGPDGMRLIAGNRFLLAEGTGGRVDEVTINGDDATIRVLREGLDSSPGVTLVGDTAYATEGKIGYLIDPKRRGQDPGTFRAVAIPLR